jgi:hypothetical protein
MGKTKKKKHKKEGGFKYKMNKRTISLKGENKKQDKHEERRSYTKNKKGPLFKQENNKNHEQYSKLTLN